MEELDAWRLTERLHAEHGPGDPFAAAVRATRMPMIITDPRQHDCPIVFANDAFLELSGYTREEVTGRNCRFLQGPETDPASVARIREAVANAVDISIDILNFRKDGTPFWNALYLSPVRSAEGELQFFFASQLDVTERVAAHTSAMEAKEVVEAEVQRRTAQLREALEAKTLLLHEVDHRVKNNLQMVASLIIMQSRTVGDPHARQSLKRLQQRIEAMATVHRRLYQSDDVARFNVLEFLRDLTHEFCDIDARDGVSIDVRGHPVELPAEKAAPMALILNEVVTNAFKHAFENGSGRIDINVDGADSRLRVVIADNGRGMPDGHAASGNFGTRLITTLGRQLRADVKWEPAGPGTRVTIELPIENASRAGDHDD